MLAQGDWEGFDRYLSCSPTERVTRHGSSVTTVFVAIAGLIHHRRATSWIIPTWYCAIC